MSEQNRTSHELRAAGPDRRIGLLKKLGTVGHPEAARLIVQYGLRDRVPRVREAAREALTQSRGEIAIDNLLVELLAHELRAANRPFPDFLTHLALSVGDRRSASTWRELSHRAQRADEAERALCLNALLSAIDRAAEDRDASVLPLLDNLRHSPLFGYSHGFRKCLLDAVCRIDEPDGIELLINALPVIDGELRWDVVDYLRRATSQDLPDDAAAWSRWRAQTVQAGKRPFERQAAAGGNVRKGMNAGAPLYYYDLPVRAKRVVFVLDVSKSMGLGGTTSRLAAAQRELCRTLENLPDDTLFNVIVFEERVAAWSERLQPATPAIRDHASAFVRGQRAQGKTATYDALSAALDSRPEPEVIYLLSDGMPSAGAITLPDRLLAAVREANHSRRIKLHALGTLAGPRDAALGQFLERLAGENYGEFRRLE